MAVSVSQGCHNRTEVYCLTVLEARSPKSRYILLLTAPGGASVPSPLPASGVASGPWPVDASLQSLPLLSHGPLPMSLHFPPLLQGHQSCQIKGPFLLQYDLILTYILMTSAKTLFPNKVTFSGAKV